MSYIIILNKINVKNYLWKVKRRREEDSPVLHSKAINGGKKKENSIKIGFTRIWLTHPCELPSKQPPHTTLSFHSLPKFP